MDALNPNAKIVRETARKANEDGRKQREARINEKRGLSASEKKVVKERKASSRKWIGNVRNYMNEIAINSKAEEIRLKKLERQI